MKTINNGNKFAWAAVAVLGAVSLGIGAHADESLVQARTVHYADLNINSPAGAEVLYQRIRSAAEQVCGNVDSRRLAEAAAAKACVDRAMSESVRAVNAPRLTDTYDAHTGAAKTSIKVATRH